jgi:hypothetical protein
MKEAKELLQTYDGWSNFETWLAYKWLVNDTAGYEQLQEAKRQDGQAVEQAQWLCDQFEESLYALLVYDQALGEGTLFVDIIQYAFTNIKWTEIVKHG